MLRFLRVPKPRPHPLLDALRALVGRVHDTNHAIRDLKEQIMANFATLNERLDALTAAVAAAQARIAEDFQALKDQLASDGTDQAAVDAAVARLDESIAALATVDPDPTNPPAEPV